MRKLGCPAPSMMRKWAAYARADAEVGEARGGEGRRGRDKGRERERCGSQSSPWC